MKKVYYWDMDGVLADFHKAYAVNRATALRRDTMAALEPFQHNVDKLNKLIADGAVCYILTKAANDAAKLGKLDWLAAHIPALDMEHFICIVGHGRKVDFIREEGVLIDDDVKNTRQWEKAGHASIHLEVKGQVVEL